MKNDDLPYKQNKKEKNYHKDQHNNIQSMSALPHVEHKKHHKVMVDSFPGDPSLRVSFFLNLVQQMNNLLNILKRLVMTEYLSYFNKYLPLKYLEAFGPSGAPLSAGPSIACCAVKSSEN